MIWFWILWVFNAIMALIPIYFFFIGMGDGTIDANNMGIWLAILAVVGLVTGGTYWLKTKNQVMAAKIILIIAAIPSLFFLLFMAISIFGNVRWN